MVDIARSPEVKRKKQIRRMIYGAVALIAIVLITRRRVAAQARGAKRRCAPRSGSTPSSAAP